MSEPLRASVVVPVWNGERHVTAALESLLAQGERLLEVIVVDDGSTDETPARLDAFGDRIRRERQPNRGVASACNLGVSRARAPIIGFLDSDDLLVPGWLEVALARFEAEPAVELVVGAVETFVSPELSAVEAARLVVPPVQPGLLRAGVLVRAAAMARVGPLDGTLPFGDFADWLARANELGLARAVLPDLACRRRLHGTNMSRVDPRRGIGLVAVAKAALDRRRARERGERPGP